jgi:primary-amine oxidase
MLEIAPDIPQYMDFDHVDNLGGVKTYKGVVCVHEQDDGIGWKHTNFRTGKPTVKRARTLVIQMVITVANYEYVFAYKLDQAAGIHLETRATGILSTTAILPGETSPYGNVVSPGVLATNHQHLFCLRIDPAIDGDNNTVVQEDSVPMPFDKANPPEDNKYGVGYVIEKTSIDQAGFADAAPEKNRVFKM